MSSLITSKQSGIVLFVALIALVVMSLAAVALIRSVDTNTLIAGNLSFKQAATSSSDAGIEAAIVQLLAMKNDPANATKKVLQDATNTLNVTNLAARPGYHSSIIAELDTVAELTDDASWSNTGAAAGYATSLATDASGNTVRYIIQRMCRTANAIPTSQDCLLSAAAVDNSGQDIELPKDICDGPGCPKSGQTPQIRVTARVEGPKNSISYVQAFVY